jgi:GAF domain-containing protein
VRVNVGAATRQLRTRFYTFPERLLYLREGLRSAVAVPIHVNGRLWGMIAVGSGQGPLPSDTEQRMTEFTDLVATAVANAQNRAELIASRARLVAASDEARRQIERDLHDGAQHPYRDRERCCGAHGGDR